jgi:serine/threonine-protein kinase
VEGRTLSHYRILERIGAGGMGVVYRARDERLQRDVALKLLPPETVSDESARRRARSEAVLLSQLNHPNVATIYDFDSDGETSFLVLEFLPGEGLDQRLTRGPLEEAEALRIGIAVADGLAAAHARGVVHRDLKPANLRVLPDGRIKVLDFGLARLAGGGGDHSIAVTQSVAGEVIAGTMAYMPPEVIAGQIGDERSDLYALGVVLYEMVAGRRPFEATSPVALMYAVLNQPPAVLRSLRPDVSAAYESLVLRAIDRDPARRPASAAAMRDELASVAAGRTEAPTEAPVTVRSLVVLPLENLSGDPAQEFFSDGMTDALISGLAQIRGLRVISRTSAMRYKGARKPLAEIAAELRIDAAIEGSIVRSRDRVRINAQLVHAATDTTVWAQSYERDVSDVLALQAEVAQAVAQEIRAAVQPGTAPSPQLVMTGAAGSVRRLKPETLDLYLRGVQSWHGRTEDGLRRSAECFEQVVRIEPDWSPAHAGLAQALGLSAFYGYLPPREAFPRARAAAERALALDDTLGDAHTVMAYILHYHDWKRAEAERFYRRGLELSPGSAVARMWYTNLLAASGRFEEARALSREALALDPLAPIIQILPGWLSFFARDFERAAVEVERGRELNPGFWWSQVWTAWIQLALGNPHGALAVMEQVIGSLETPPEEVIAALATTAAAAGDPSRARALLDDLDRVGQRRYISGYFHAVAYGVLGDMDEAFKRLRQAIAGRSHHLMWIDVDTRIDPLRTDQRFEDVRREVGLTS